MSIEDFGIIIGGIGGVISISCLLAKCFMSIGGYRTHMKDYEEYNNKKLDELSTNFMTISKKIDDLSDRFQSQEIAIDRLKGKIEKIEKSKE